MKDSKEFKQPQVAKTIAFVHHKGGTGKTTSCLNIAGWLVKMNKKVLVVDLDPQGCSSCGSSSNILERFLILKIKTPPPPPPPKFT